MAMSSIMSNLGGFMACSSSSFTTRVCQNDMAALGSDLVQPQPYIVSAPLWRHFPAGATSAPGLLLPSCRCHPWDRGTGTALHSAQHPSSHRRGLWLSGKQLTCTPHHLELDPFNPANPSLGEISPYISGCEDLDLANGLVNASETKSEIIIFFNR